MKHRENEDTGVNALSRMGAQVQITAAPSGQTCFDEEERSFALMGDTCSGREIAGKVSKHHIPNGFGFLSASLFGTKSLSFESSDPM